MSNLSALEAEYGITAEAAREQLWRMGILDFKLDSNQLEMVNNFRNSLSKRMVWNCSRQLGKSYCLSTIAIQECLQKKNIIVKFLAPTQKMVRVILRPLFRELIADAPHDIKPEERVADGEWYFPSTGSKIQIAGCDGGRADNVRGTKADLCIIDEAGFVDKDLDYIVKSVLLPLTTTTGGKMIIASTPPVSPDHDFVKFFNEARGQGAAIHKTIFDNPRLTRAQIDQLAYDAGGHDSINFRREYLAQIIKDDTRAVIPEFDEALKSRIVKEWPRPPHYDTYVAMDVGMKDLTVVLFAYHDFRAGKLIIEDEIAINGQKFNTTTLSEGIKEKEQKVFTDPRSGEFFTPYKRVSDNNLILIQDLYQLHGLFFLPTKKDDADSALNNVRILIKEESIIINPRCEVLIRHLESAVWNKQKTSYSRSDFDKSHYDAVDSLKYLVRNVDFYKNPYPSNYGRPSGPGYYQRNNPMEHPQNNAWAKIINLKKKH